MPKKTHKHGLYCLCSAGGSGLRVQGEGEGGGAHPPVLGPSDPGTAVVGGSTPHRPGIAPGRGGGRVWRGGRGGGGEERGGGGGGGGERKGEEREGGRRAANHIEPHLDTRRLEVVADRLPLFHGAQLAMDTTMVSAVRRDGLPRPRSVRDDGAAARRMKERTYLELTGQFGPTRLVVLAREVGGRWSGG